MSSIRLILASLFFHARLNIAVALGVVAGTAVLTGALVVGDSVRGSLRDLTLDRLGRINEVLVTDHFFRTELADELQQSLAKQRTAIGREALPAILLNGSVENPDRDRIRRASKVTLLGVDDSFWKLGRGGARRPPAVGEVILNRPLAEELQARVGQDVLVRFGQTADVPAESSLGRKTDTVESRRLTVTDIIPAEGLGRFGLSPNQQLPLNAYMATATLQSALGQRGHVNALLMAGRPQDEPSPADAATLQKSLRPTLQDYGLRLEEAPLEGGRRYFNLSSTRMLMPEYVEQQVKRRLGDTSAAPVLTYLANSISASGNPDAAKEVPYSTVAALDFPRQGPLGPWLDTNGDPIPPLKNNEIVLNRWAADNLEVQPGDEVALTFFRPESTHGKTEERTESFRLKAIVELAGLAADRNLTPELKGVTDQKSIDEWDPPFPFEASRVRDEDEEYWDEHRATPKAFVSLATGRRLWASRFGQTTAFRIPANAKTTVASLTQKLDLDPARLGFQFQPVKLQGLAAASGTTPFNLLFLGFSFFIIAAAVMLVAILFRLGIDQRAQEIGILLASGLGVGKVRGLLAAESFLVASVGGLIGMAAGVGYAWLMLAGLRSWWLAAITTPFLELHVSPASLVIGYFSGVLLSFAAAFWGLWQMRRVPVRRLLSGQAAEDRQAQHPRSWPRAIPWVAIVLAIGTGLLAMQLEGEAQAGAFFGSGALILTALLTGIWQWLSAGTSGSGITAGGWPLARLATRNAARHPGRSTLTIGLVAAATFLIVAISAFRLEPPSGVPDIRSGNGGYLLVAESGLPVYHDPGSSAGRAELGFGPKSAEAFKETRSYPIRVKPGDDASCLNLYQVSQPRVLGLPADFIERGGFAWAKTLAETAAEQENPWLLLNRKPGRTADGQPIVPVIADNATAAYSLHLGLGDRLEIAGDQGQTTVVELVGLLKNSIFQGELLMGEATFLDRFPEVAGYRYFLFATPPDRADEVTASLEKTLASQGLDVERTQDRLASFMAVQNTYLSTFQSLGGLGLLLGTFGLATVQLRSVLERRGELALLRATGFPRKRLARLVMLENALLLAGGLGTGIVAALVAVTPHLIGGGAAVPWPSLATTLALVLSVGLLAGLAAVRATLTAPLLAALRGD